jgi:anti-anti-sigma regulatory factor
MGAEHWFVTYEDERDRELVAAGLLSDGLSRGEQVGFFGWGTAEELRQGLEGLDGVDELIERGAARVASLDEHFRPDAPPEPNMLVRFWSDATAAALDAGFSGLRVVADTTPWSDLPREQRTVFLQGEQLINRYRLDHPFTLICSGDASVLQPDALADTALIHPAVQGVSLPFRLYATDDADFVLSGEMDALGVDLFEHALNTLPHLVEANGLMVDAADLDFIDHTNLLTLERHAERHELATVVLRNPPHMARRLVDLLDLRRVRAEGPR